MEYQDAFKLQNLAGTLWLFTKSDMKTFVLPQTLFGIFSALAGPLLTTNDVPGTLDILSRVPHVLLWTWLNTLIFDLANQRLAEAVMEDKLNKPWRPLPAGRISQEQARYMLLVTIPICLFVIHFCIGATEETTLLLGLDWMYNDLGGSDDSFIVRNAIIAVAFTLYGSGALRVASGVPSQALTPGAIAWLIMIGLIIFTTMSVQDLKDVSGDRARNRRTAPLVVGEAPTRYFLACGVVFWSIHCSIYWKLGLKLSLMLFSFGALIATRVVTLHGEAADRKTWKLWAYWLTAVYALPWVKFIDIQSLA